MSFTEIVDRVTNKAPDDYIKDGVLYCGVCNQPKQRRGPEELDYMMLPVACQCVQAKRNEEEERERKMKIAMLRSSCLPVAAMRTHTFQTANDEKHIRIAKRYVEKWDQVRAENIGLLFWGNTGTGKSYTAQCIANALIDQGISVMYITAANLIAKMGQYGERDGIINQLVTKPLVIIDDVGAGRDTSFANEQLCTAIDTRSETGKPLIVTTNYTLSEMDTCADIELQRIFNRIKACCTAVAVTGTSKRNAISDEKLKRAREILEI